MKLTFQEALDRSMMKLGLVPVRVNFHPDRATARPKKTRPSRRSKAGKNGKVGRSRNR